MLNKVRLHSFEPDLPYETQGPFTAEIIEIDKTGRAAAGYVEPPILIPFGEYQGKHIRSFVFTPRHVGVNISDAESGFSVVYLHPYEGLLKIPVENINTEMPSEGMSSAIGYCVMESHEPFKFLH